MSADVVSLSVVIPAYNEERRLGATLDQVCGFLSGQSWHWEVRVVDDGSHDRTAAIAEAAVAREPRVRVQREPHRGKGAAVKAGLLAAEGQYRFICDADLSMPIAEIRRFLPPALTGFEVAIGSREGVAARRIGEPIHRHLLGRLFNLGVRWLTLPGIQDSQCGFKMFTADAVRTIFPQLTVDGWAFDVEVLTIARQRQLRIVEVPIEWHYRRESQINMVRDGVAMLREVLRIRARAIRGLYR
jgi:dolichyl-phosphate beta-glucosyltransferase